jgi:hypothetical protein
MAVRLGCRRGRGVEDNREKRRQEEVWTASGGLGEATGR